MAAAASKRCSRWNNVGRRGAEGVVEQALRVHDAVVTALGESGAIPHSDARSRSGVTEGLHVPVDRAR